MQTLCFKENGGIVQNPIAQPSSLRSMPWWGPVGSQAMYGGSFGRNQLMDAPRPTKHGTNQGLEKESYNTSQFTIVPGDGKDSGKVPMVQELQANMSQQPSPPGYQACFELGLGQPVVCANYPYVDQCYGVFATYGAPKTGHILLPLNVKSEDGPIYVNAKQYHGIIRRRQLRAKAEMENKVVKARKPYLHESRHRHAMRRERGCGGRFLTKNGKGGTDKDKAGEKDHSQPSGSPSSEVLESKNRNFNSSKEAFSSESNLSGSEVTSMYPRGDVDRFQINHFLSSSFHTLPNTIDGEEGINTPKKWVTAADGCCDLLKV